MKYFNRCNEDYGTVEMKKDAKMQTQLNYKD